MSCSIIISVIIIIILPALNMIPREFKNFDEKKKNSIRAVNGRQTVMKKDSIEALHQYRDPLVQEACLSSLTRVQRNPPSKVIKEAVS